MIRHFFLFCVFILLSGRLCAETVRVDSAQKVGWIDSLQCNVSTLLQDEFLSTSQLGLCVYDLTEDTMLYTYNARQMMRPASTQKIVTAVSALSFLGSLHCFETRLYHTGAVCDSVLQGDVYAVGGFDPCFGRKDMDMFVKSLVALGIDSIAGSLYADVSMKDTLKWGWGWCWDDEMPVLTPLLYDRKDVFIERLGEGLNRVGIGYAGQGKCRLPEKATLVCSCSTPLIEVLRPMMKDSDNLFAESVFYRLAALNGHPYASRKDAMFHIEKLIGEMGFDPARYLVADGSGASLYNYLTAELEMAFLRYAWHDKAIFSVLYDVLPIAGVDGTLSRRMRDGKTRGNVRAKTGTLKGVSSLAGYLRNECGHWLAFCILNQGVMVRKDALDFQDKFCELLCR